MININVGGWVIISVYSTYRL